MTSLHSHATRWLADEPFPGIVEVRFPDATGRLVTLVDKAVVFDAADSLRRDATYPISVSIPVEIVGRSTFDGEEMLLIALPWGLGSDLVQHPVEVRISQTSEP